MNEAYRKTRASWLIAAAFCLAVTGRLGAQAAANNPSTASDTNKDSDEETLTLSPFVVESAADQQGYSAKDTLAGTRVRTDIGDVASAISIFTAKFLDDTGATNSQDLLVYTPNTEVGGIFGNYSGGQAGELKYSEQLINPSSVTRVRGLDSADNTRDYFATEIPWDSYNTGRIDLQRGPNSILFGEGSPAGIINNSLNDASYTNAYKVENRVSSYGSTRDSIDLNYVVLKDKLAFRFASVVDDELYQQTQAYNNSKKYYLAGRYDPVIFGKNNHTTIRVKIENGEVSSNNPRALPPVDMITPFFQSGTNAYGNKGVNKTIVNEYVPGDAYPSAYAQSLYDPGQQWAMGASYGYAPLAYYDSATKSSTPQLIISGMPTQTLSNNNSIGDFPFFRPLAIEPFGLYATNAPVAIPGGSYYSDKVLTDPSIFNFYDNLLDGPNKHEWQNWHTQNISLEQAFFHDRLNMQLVYDQQRYNSGQIEPLSGDYYGIGIDVNGSLPDGSTNPNAGRPYVASSATFGNSSADIARHSLRYTANVELKATDLFKKGLVTDVLGRSVITGLLSEDKKTETDLQWSEYAATTDYASAIYQTLASLQGARAFNWVDYIGPSLLSANSASGANLSAIQNYIVPAPTTAVRYFNATWNAPSSVNSAAAFTVTNWTDGTTSVGTQVNNPANYVGWSNFNVNWLNADQNFADLLTTANRYKFADISKGVTWQGYLFDGTLVPTFGWRKDTVITYGTTSPVNTSTGLSSLNFLDDPNSRRQATGESKSWGGVYHIPKYLTDHLPWGMSVSAFYDRSSNFKADAARYNLFGDALPNPQGITKEYGITLGFLNDKVTVKADKYNTRVTAATYQANFAGLGPNAYDMWDVPAVGYIFASFLQEGLSGRYSSNPYANAFSGFWNYAQQDNVTGLNPLNPSDITNPAFVNAPETALSQQAVNAWVNNFPLNAKFFTYYGMHPASINPALAKSSGLLSSAISNFTPETGSGLGEYGNLLTAVYETAGPVSPVSTVDTISEGEEYEVNTQISKNWNFTLNYVRTFATHENIDGATVAYMQQLYQFFTGPGGYVRMWGQASFATGKTWINNVYNGYLTELNSAGQSAPEVSPWRLNAISTYTFDRGVLKGGFVGGAARLEAGRIEGYRYSPSLGQLDVHQPFLGSNDTHFDFWIGYRHLLTHNVNWKIQLNLHNVLEKTRLVSSYYEPDGSLALARIQEGQTVSLTNTLEF